MDNDLIARSEDITATVKEPRQLASQEIREAIAAWDEFITPLREKFGVRRYREEDQW